MEEKRKARTTNQTQILSAIQSVDEKVIRLNNILIGNVDEDKPGLMERVRKLEEWVANEKKLIYLIVAIIITDIVTRLWTLIVI
jgi:hypothetical protein